MTTPLIASVEPPGTSDEPESPRPAGRPGRNGKRVDALTASLFLAPGILAFLIFAIIPALAGLVLSFFSWDLFSPPEFVGFANIARLFSDAEMWQSLGVTGLFVVLGVIPTVFLGFLLAVLVNSSLKGVGAIRILYFAPMIASAAVSSVIWATLYSPRNGFINQALEVVGIQGPNWLSDTTWARPALVIMMIWSALPLVIILYLAGLQRVPEDIYAAASLDGAGKWRQLWSMTWPNVVPTTLLVTVLEAVSFVSGSFEIALIMTNGGPLGTTQSLALYSYQVAFTQHDVGYASALSLFQLVVMAAIVVVVRQVMLRVRKGRA